MFFIALQDSATDKGKRSQPELPQKDFQFAFNSTMHMLNRQSDIKRFSQKRSTFCFLILTMIMFGHLNLSTQVTMLANILMMKALRIEWREMGEY